jgi:hypothetical protein
MKPYAAHLAPAEDLAALAHIRDLVEKLPEWGIPQDDDSDSHALVSCHTLARAFASVMKGLIVVDGHVLGHEHSWLVTRSRNIIDVYPVATVSGPLLIMNSLYARTLYKPSRGMKVRQHMTPTHYRSHVRGIARAVRRASTH